MVIYIVEDDTIMAECMSRALNPLGATIKCFTNAITAMAELSEQVPDLILLDILLDGPDGFTLLNELASYTDTAQIPVILVTSLNLALADVGVYGVKEIIDKATMTPAGILAAAERWGETHAT